MPEALRGRFGSISSFWFDFQRSDMKNGELDASSLEASPRGSQYPRWTFRAGAARAEPQLLLVAVLTEIQPQRRIIKGVWQ